MPSVENFQTVADIFKQLGDGIPGAADLQVSLENKKATVNVPESVTDEALKAAVTEAGYKVTGITTHEG